MKARAGILRQLSTSCCFLSLVLPVVFLGVFRTGPAWAIPLTNTSVSQDYVQGDQSVLRGNAVAPLSISAFDFDPGVGGTEGYVLSQVFAGNGPAAGGFVYLYMIQLASSSVSSVSELSFAFDASLSVIPGVGTSFFVDGLAHAPSEADYTDLNLSFSFLEPDQISPGSSSTVFGVVSSHGPKIVQASVLDGDQRIASASVYATAPEPGTMLLMGSALLGFGILRRRRAF